MDLLSALLWPTVALVASIAFAWTWIGRAQAQAAARSAEQEADRLADRLWSLVDSEERYRGLIEAQGDLIVRREGGHIAYANQAFAELCGCPADDLIGTDLSPRIRVTTASQLLDSGARLFDECVETAAGERWIAWVETATIDESGRPVVQRVGRDVTQRVASEQAIEEARLRAEQASAAKSRFLATVSHEFRTPLNGILGVADLLGDTRLDAEQTSYVRALRVSGEALLSLVEEILDFARIESGKLELAREPVELAGLVETVAELLAPSARDKRLDLATAVSADLPPAILGDRARLRQILINLLGNAVKFTAEGGVGLSMTREDDSIVIAVEDTGPGIAPEHREAVFVEFERGENDRAGDGTGLGLPIVRRLATAMGGTVTIEDRPGGGSRLVTRLPLDPAQDARIEPRQPEWTGRTILIVSAEPFTPTYLARSLCEMGAGGIVASTGAEAARMLATHAFAGVVIDAGIDGAEDLVAQARAAGIEERLVMLQGGGRRGFAPYGEAGFTGFLVKPVRLRTLQERIGGGTVRSRAETSEAAAAPSTPSLRILVAEDNEINALIVTRMLARLGCEAVLVGDGAQAVAAIEDALAGRADPFDAALLDVRMPVLDGLSCARAIRAAERREGRRPLALIAVTANATPADLQAAIAAGMDDCLPKPLQRQDLAQRLAGLRDEPVRVRSA